MKKREEIDLLRTQVRELRHARDLLIRYLESECGDRCNAEYNPCSARQVLNKIFTHPTTERPYNPLNDYAVIPMNPTTEPVKAQAGEVVDYRYKGADGLWYRTIPHDVKVIESQALYIHPTTERRETLLDAHARQVEAEEDGEPVAWMNKRGDVISAEEKTLIIENGKLGHPGGEFDLHAKNVDRSYTIPLGVIND